jgi:hypothetical protein
MVDRSPSENRIGAELLYIVGVSDFSDERGHGLTLKVAST